MPPKAKKINTFEGDLTNVMYECLNGFFSEFSWEFGCAGEIVQLTELVTDCNSIIGSQSALIRQLQSDMCFLKNEISKLRPNRR